MNECGYRIEIENDQIGDYSGDSRYDDGIGNSRPSCVDSRNTPECLWLLVRALWGRLEGVNVLR